MRAMILAAGYGTRLLPYTGHTPKPLFTIAGRPILDRMIRRMVRAGAEAIIVNTHHLSDQIEHFLASQNYGIPVQVSHEPEIMGTGGALKNVSHFWGDDPFLVANSDIVTDIDFNTVYRYHQKHDAPVTLVLCSDPEFNQVSIDPDGRIVDFRPIENCNRTWTFTGVHVIDPVVLEHIPPGRFVNIIDTYRNLMRQGHPIQAYQTTGVTWDDVGSPHRYSVVARREAAAAAFAKVFPEHRGGSIHIQQLKGDGSDRRWFRLAGDQGTLIMVDHGIRYNANICEADAFVNIGNHLYEKGAPVPKIWFSDTFAGIVCMQDLGDRHLQDFVTSAKTESSVVNMYKNVVQKLVHMSQTGIQGFQPAWAWQSQSYDKALVLEKECRYFVDAFLNGYLNMKISYQDLEPEFIHLADGALKYAVPGFMHRDFQSRNIMIKDGHPYFIDFQGGRKGPLQYDLASLLIDPYAALEGHIQDRLLEFCVSELTRFCNPNADEFKSGYRYCAITRNLQALGAFGHLTQNMGKSWFETYIPIALKTLSLNLERFFTGHQLKKLKRIVEKGCQTI